MHWPSLTLFANGAPMLLNDRWLLNLTADRPRVFTTTHELDIRLEPAVPPTVPVDFLWVVWRVRAGGSLQLTSYATPLAAETEAGPGGPRMFEYCLYHPDAIWHTRSGRERRGVTFTVEHRPVWRPKPKD